MSQSEVLSLDEHARQLVAWLRTVHAVPHFDAIVVLDTAEPSVEYVAVPRHRWRAPASAVRSIPEAASRFDQYLRAGYSWVNLSVYGLLGTTLVLGVELPPQGPTGIPVGRTPVNYSGPSLDPQTRTPIWHAPLEIEERM